MCTRVLLVMYQAILAHFLVCRSFQQDENQIKFSHYGTLLLTKKAEVIFNVTVMPKVFCNGCENLFVFAAKSYCHPNPCLHGGSCVDIKDGYTCKCPGFYRGTNCEGIPINSLQPRDNRDLKIERRRRQRERQKSNRFN